ncbi:MAG: hypothetical protein EBR82_42185 [Caulobacteraceae bacterium]|nr:hypothetical protein [Caulobacteraceae bacterium]
MSNYYGYGIKILPHDPLTFLVQSRTNREDFHLVDISEDTYTCTCSGYQFRKECFHIRYLCKLLGVKTPQANNNNNNQLKKAA